MQRTTQLLLCLVALVATAAACSTKVETPPRAAETPAATETPAVTETPAATETPVATDATHGAAGAVPGSHEDWCGEHQVAESMCTRCNPALVAAFKATGDWCAEHGLPESQCLVCNPHLKIVRPPKAGGA